MNARRKIRRRPSPLAVAFALGAVFLAAPTALAAAPDDPLYVDLNASSLFARIGFDPSLIGIAPAHGEPGWKELPPAGPAGRLVRPIELGFEGMPKRPPFSLASYPTMEFTYLIPFRASAEMAALIGASSGNSAAAPKVPGVYLAGIGDNYEIYLNGVLVRSEMHLTADGKVGGHRAMRNQRFPVDGRLFREGSNVLAIRIVADPTYLPSGLYQAKPFYVGEYKAIELANDDVGPMVLIGLYLFIGLYHLSMFGARTKDRHNLYYGLFSLDLGVYLLMRTYTITLILGDSDIVSRVELVSLSFILPLVGAFLETLNDNRIKKITLWYGAFCAFVALGELLLPMAFAIDMLRLWQLSGLIMAFYYFGIDILGRFLSDGNRRWKRERGAEGGRSLGSILGTALLRTPIGNLLIGGAILFATAIFDIVDAVVMQWDLLLTKYGFFVFTMGTAIILANRLGFLHDRLSGLNRTLEEQIGVLTETGAKLKASERRYRSLFEGSSEPVALLTEGLAFIEGNRAAAELFGLDRPGRAPESLVDAVYAEKREGTLPVEFLRAAARSLNDRKAPSEITLRIKAPVGDPKSCKLRLERIDELERREILLRVVPETKDPLDDAFVEGRERFDVESSLTAADEVCRRASAHLSHFMPSEEARFLASCLREVVVNAVEHGNLQLSFDEKSASMTEGRYFELLQERRLDPRYRSRRVAVEYSVSASRATFRVTDEGPGFDYRKYERGAEEPDPELLEHGRGLFLTMSAFDKVAFNEKGNQVTLVKFFGGESAKAPG
jgi:PAS domain-containing protein